MLTNMNKLEITMVYIGDILVCVDSINVEV